ncbi:MAG: AAA-like domain-containing protein [Aphanocapsa lilacina HA4352-LM1]|jgi:hypothetical protein|nr:AAA-like domain-containing protein [Aphanocapsa lilacina HA4352-LM1]
MKASETALEKIQAARVAKGWTIEDERWLLEASRLLQPERVWHPGGPYADGASLPTFKRFLAGASIREPAFRAFCRILNLDWRRMSDLAADPNGTPSTGLGDEPIYVGRSPHEELAFAQLTRPGALLRIKAARQMGKTRFVEQLLEKAAASGCRTVTLTFKLADERLFCDHDAFLKWLCVDLGRELELPNRLDRHWDADNASPKSNCTDYMEKYFLQPDSPLAVCFDDVDLLFAHPGIHEPFFSLLRSWHERASSHRKAAIWGRLRIVLVYSTDIYAPLGIEESPLNNVGTVLELPEFDLEQVRQFARGHGLDWDEPDARRLFEAVGGHPYLIELIVRYLRVVPQSVLGRVLEEAATESGIYSAHLRHHLRVLKRAPQLAAAFKRVLDAREPVRLDPSQAFQLQRTGLARAVGDALEPRCQLYRKYFAQHF